jgi:large subunit ribosomal protein L9
MEVILREDIETLGARGQVVKVAAGYARNFLLPKRLAVAATASNKKIVEQERQAALRREAKEKGAAEELAKLLATVTLATTQKAGEQDVLFGSVTAKDINELLEKAGYTIDRRKILLEAPIKTLGEHKIGIRLFKDVIAEVTLQVNKEETKEDTKEEPKAESKTEEPA